MLIQLACENLVASRGFDGAWIIANDFSSKQIIHGCNGSECCNSNVLAAMFQEDKLPECCRHCQAEGGIFVTDDPSVTCKDCPMPHIFHGNAAMTIELCHNGQHYGWMAVSIPAKFATAQEEKNLLTEIAGDIAFALHGIMVAAERQKSEQTLQAIFQSASDGILLADIESGLFVTANEAICQMLGYSDEEIKRLTIADIHPFESLDYVRSQFEKQARCELTIAIDIPVKRKNGTVFTADINSAPLDLEGRRYLLGIFRDITDRKKTEKQLMEAYDIINRSSSVAFNWKNQEGWPVEFVSENVDRIFGYTAEEFMTGKVKYAGCIHPDDLERVAREVAEFSSKPEKTEFIHEPYRIIAKDGSVKTVDDRTSIVRSNDGSITHYKGIVEDITEQKKSYEERKNLEEQLWHAQKLEDIGRLTSGIAHDFNNLLTTIIGNADMAIMDMDKDSYLYEIMQEIKEAGDRAAGLTRQLLAFSRKQILQPEVMDINHAINEISKILRRVIGEDISFETHLSPDLSQVEADVGQIEQVLMNLVVNARDAMPSGGKLTIETSNIYLDEDYALLHISVTPGPYVMLAVSDTGVGMTKQMQAHIFEPFYTTKKNGKGTGLGLSTVYGIVKQSGGNIWVYSEPGKGAVFKIYLPAIGKDVSEQDKIKNEDMKDIGGTETVLIVEDDESLKKIAVKVLEKYGYTVLKAAEGGEALMIFEENKALIRLVVTDVVMPDMSGTELAERLRNMTPDLKVLFMSGYTDDTTIHHGIQEKKIAFLEKPFTPEGLVRKVREILDN
jgi:PAS domain S-box-containing protein